MRFLLSPWGKAGLLSVALVLSVGVGTFTYFYVKYARLTDEALKAGPFSNMSLLYAAPRPVTVGDEARGEEIADVSAPVRVLRIQQQPRRLVPGPSRRHRDQSRSGRLRP